MKKLYAGQVDPAHDPQIRELLTAMKKILITDTSTATTPLLPRTTANILRTDKALLYPMGDWAKGLFTSSGWKPKVDYDFQLSLGIQAFHCDFFAMAKKAPHKTSVRKWLEYIKTVEAQTIFNPIKGSIPPSLNAPTDPYDPSPGTFLTLPGPEQAASPGLRCCTPGREQRGVRRHVQHFCN